MARIRSVHPGFFTTRRYVICSPLARLLCIGIWGEADDQGVFDWSPFDLKIRVLPADNVDVEALLAELVAADAIRSFVYEGRKYGLVRNFKEWQRPKKPNKVHPLPPEHVNFVGGRRDGGELDDDEGGGISPPSTSSSSTSSEPKARKRPSGSPLKPRKTPPVPHEFRTEAASSGSSSRLLPQMEDGGWRMEDGEEKIPPPATVSGANKRRGTRLSADWQPDQAAQDFARSLGLDPPSLADHFRDFWHAKPGASAVKLDWDATWRNWCREEARRRAQTQSTGRSRSRESQEEFARYLRSLEPEPEPVSQQGVLIG